MDLGNKNTWRTFVEAPSVGKSQIQSAKNKKQKMKTWTCAGAHLENIPWGLGKTQPLTAKSVCLGRDRPATASRKSTNSKPRQRPPVLCLHQSGHSCIHPPPESSCSPNKTPTELNPENKNKHRILVVSMKGWGKEAHFHDVTRKHQHSHVQVWLPFFFSDLCVNSPPPPTCPFRFLTERKVNATNASTHKSCQQVLRQAK